MNLGYDSTSVLSYEDTPKTCVEKLTYDPGYSSEKSPEEEETPGLYERLKASETPDSSDLYERLRSPESVQSSNLYERLRTPDRIQSPGSDMYERLKSPETDYSLDTLDRLRASSEETQTSESSSVQSSLPRLRLPNGEPLSLNHLMDICPFINDG